MKISALHRYKEPINDKYQKCALPFMFGVKMRMENFAAWCYSHCMWQVLRYHLRL